MDGFTELQLFLFCWDLSLYSIEDPRIRRDHPSPS